jgi:hypothetical protein
MADEVDWDRKLAEQVRRNNEADRRLAEARRG